MIMEFHIIPASGRAMVFLAALGLLTFALFASIAYMGFSSMGSRFEISDRALRISNTFYGRSIPLSAIDTDSVAVVNMKSDGAYKPTLRTNGIGMPGYAAGWFRLRGKGKALLFVTDRENVVYLPTSEGYSLLLSVDRPREFMEALRSAARRQPGS